MKAAVITGYGTPDVIKIMDVEKPVLNSDEIFIRVKFTGVNSGDCRIRRADPFAVRFIFGYSKPRFKIPGGVFSGVVEAAGKGVGRFKVGDRVFGSTGIKFGTSAEYITVKQNGLVKLIPGELSMEEAASIPFGYLSALGFLKKATIKPHQSVLIFGATGSVGSAAIQLAKSFNARVIAVCNSSGIKIATQLGADEVIPYDTADVYSNDHAFDVIFDTTNKMNIPKGLRSLKKGGTLILGAAGLSEMLKGRILTLQQGKKILCGPVKQTLDNLNLLCELAGQNKIKPIIDKIFTLDQIVDAHEYVDTGHKKGNVVLKV